MTISPLYTTPALGHSQLYADNVTCWVKIGATVLGAIVLGATVVGTTNIVLGAPVIEPLTLFQFHQYRVAGATVLGATTEDSNQKKMAAIRKGDQFEGI